jgi:predicted metalloprotease
MRWQGRRGSENVEDRRAAMGGRGVRIGGIGTIILVLIALYFGADLGQVLNLVQNVAPPPGQQGEGGAVDPAQDELAQMVSVVLADTEDVWTEQFRQMGQQYEKPRLVLFRREVRSACGFASAASGPFYCPADRQVYIDLDFFQQLRDRFQAPGDFAQAYVIAHEVGHHVQNLLGLTDQVHSKRGVSSEEEYNALSVRLELQADYLAGVWAHHAQQNWNILEAGDVEEALNAASAIGDDKIQKEARGYVVPESFTHGTSEQRVRWFRKGLQTGDMEGMMEAFETDRL